MIVNCAFDKMVPLDELKPHKRNPNRHPQWQLELLAKVMQAHGWRSPDAPNDAAGQGE